MSAALQPRWLCAKPNAYAEWDTQHSDVSSSLGRSRREVAEARAIAMRTIQLSASTISSARVDLGSVLAGPAHEAPYRAADGRERDRQAPGRLHVTKTAHSRPHATCVLLR